MYFHSGPSAYNIMYAVPIAAWSAVLGSLELGKLIIWIVEISAAGMFGCGCNQRWCEPVVHVLRTLWLQSKGYNSTANDHSVWTCIVWIRSRFFFPPYAVKSTSPASVYSSRLTTQNLLSGDSDRPRAKQQFAGPQHFMPAMLLCGRPTISFQCAWDWTVSGRGLEIGSVCLCENERVWLPCICTLYSQAVLSYLLLLFFALI